MSTATLVIDDLPVAPGEAAARYYDRWAGEALRLALAPDTELLVVLFGAGDYTHAEWRRVAVAALARQIAPRRVCALAGGGDAARADALAFLSRAPGVTGQYLELAD